MNNYKLVIDNINYEIIVDILGSRITIKTLSQEEDYDYFIPAIKNKTSFLFIDEWIPQELILFIQRIISMDIFS